MSLQENKIKLQRKQYIAKTYCAQHFLRVCCCVEGYLQTYKKNNMANLQELLGDSLIGKDDKEAKTSELPSEQGAVIGLYFSAHWCPPCRGFTPILKNFYEVSIFLAK